MTSVNLAASVAQTTRKPRVPRSFAENLNEACNALGRCYNQSADTPVQALLLKAYTDVLRLNNVVIKAQGGRDAATN